MGNLNRRSTCQRIAVKRQQAVRSKAFQYLAHTAPKRFNFGLQHAPPCIFGPFT